MIAGGIVLLCKRKEKEEEADEEEKWSAQTCIMYTHLIERTLMAAIRFTSDEC